MDTFGLKGSLFILDKGFYSEKNIKEMESEGIKFLIPLPFNTKVSKDLILLHKKRLGLPRNSFLFGKRVMFHCKDKVFIGGKEYLAHIYLDQMREAEERGIFLKKVIELEGKVKEKGLKKREEVLEYIEDIQWEWGKFFNIYKRGGCLKIRKNEEELYRIMDRFGKAILISNDFKMEKEEAIQYNIIVKRI